MADKDFNIMIIEPNSFDFNNIDWNGPDYCQIIISQPFIKTIEVTNKNLLPKIQEILNANESNIIVPDIIGEEYYHNYEMIFIDTLNKKSDLPVNSLGSMLSINGEIIRGTAILIKNHIPTLSNDRYVDNMTSSELYKLLYNRAINKVVVWDEMWRESEVFGDINVYADKFFDGEKYDKLEIGFLKHNLNIWYQKSDYGNDNLCGKLMDCKVEKILIFTMITKEKRGNISKLELEKILKLSTVLTPPYDADTKWDEEEKDEHNRIIIKNKYRVLDTVYQTTFG
jgi:hypothetical protein